MTLSLSSRRAGKRWSALIVIVATFSLLAAAVALAVHDESNIQLDGNAITDAASTVGNGTEDWDLICKAHLSTNTPAGECVKNPAVTLPAGTTTATSSQFIADAFGADTDDIYTTGGSKDDLDIPSWKFKNATPSPDKADLEHAMAALYSNGEKFVYFGADRYTNNGDVNIAFWFFQNEVKEGGDGGATPSDPPDHTLCSSASGCGFQGAHVAHGAGPDGYICYPGMAGYKAIEITPLPDQTCAASGGVGADDTRGDILVVSAFTGGGVQPNIQVYEWVGANNAPNLPATGGLPKKDLKVTSNRSVVVVPTGATLSAGCATTGLTDDPGCAIVNSGELTNHPWTFVDKGTGSGNPQQGEFFEGGLNLTALGFGDTCFSSFLVNTRSSQSVDSVLHDFALGQLGSCNTSLTTAASLNAAGTAIDNGSTAANGTASSGTDTATLTVNGVSTWGGTLKWYLCGPLTSGAVCTSSGYLVTTRSVTNASPASDFVSGSVSLTSAGRYCWFGEFTPDAATAAKGVTGDSDDGSDTSPNPECFTVRPVTPTLDTDAGDGPVDFGNAVTDTATLSGAAKEPGNNGTNTTYPSIGATNGAFVGTIGFTLKGPGDDGSATPAVCSTTDAVAKSGTTPTTFPINSTVTGNTTYGPVSFTPNAPGNYHWIATYSHTATTVNNSGLPVTHNATCGDADESVTVRQIPTSIKTNQSWYPNDTATIASSVVGDSIAAGGTVDFRLYNSLTCTGTVQYSERVTIAAGDIASGVATVSTKNYPGGAGTAVPGESAWSAFKIATASGDAANSTKSYSWKVVYTPAAADTVHLGRQSACSTSPASTEKFTITYTNDDSGGTPLP